MRTRLGGRLSPAWVVSHRVRAGAFTLLELLVACAVFLLLLVLLLSAIGQTSQLVGRSTQSVTAFQEARTAFELMTRSLSQATLNTYWDYRDAAGDYRTSANAGTFQPKSYGRNSDLHFLLGDAGSTPGAGYSSLPGTPGTGQAVFFQYPSGRTASATYRNLEQLLNASGYFIQYGDREALPAPFPGSDPKYRFRLMQARQVSESLEVFTARTGNAWIQNLSLEALPIADNIVYALIWPRKSPVNDPEGDDLTNLNVSGGFAFDSRPDSASAALSPQPDNVHQLPPVLQITLVALDETTAARVCTSASPPSAVTGLFNGLFATPTQTQFDTDLQTLEQRMGTAGFGFRIFSTTIPLKECKMQ
ncbi:MAG: hypothetical protein IAE94_00995 [Chthoniobacterales bacterium]|nr:hypothetical protein [Chthoniobacterales bacterium]